MGYNKMDKRPVLTDDRYRLSGLIHSTAASTALNPAGVYGFTAVSTSTATPTRWHVGQPKPGDVFEASVVSLVSTAQGVAIVAASGMTWDGTNDQADLLIKGAGFRAVALSSARWLVTGGYTVAFSTST